MAPALISGSLEALLPETALLIDLANRALLSERRQTNVKTNESRLQDYRHQFHHGSNKDHHERHSLLTPVLASVVFGWHPRNAFFGKI